MAVKCLNQVVTDSYAAYNGDSCELLTTLPDESVDYCLFSPPFADLYCYSDNERDISNSQNYEEFFEHFHIIASELHRLSKPGRLVSVHCVDIPAMKERDGYIGLKDFPGDIIRLFQDCGFIYHSRHTIWKDPLIEATRTKALGLMHKQLCKDSAMCRAGLPDYLLGFRKQGENQTPITHESGLHSYHGSMEIEGHGTKRAHNIWRAYASPVWMDVRQTVVLSHRNARAEKDEKHLCPLQLDVVNRCIQLWSNPGETVLTPFMGVGSEVYGAVVNGRRGVGIELKESYFNQAVRNLAAAEAKQDEQAEFVFAENA